MSTSVDKVSGEKNTAKGVSVIVCCYNSAARLPKTLLYLANQKVVPEFRWEVIVIDNASTDNTADVALQIWNSTGSAVPMNIIKEQTPGLSAARKSGVVAARYEVVIFCDDDNCLDEGYVQCAWNLMREHSDVGVLGGMGIPDFESAPPPWFEYFSKSYAVGPQAEQPGRVDAPAIVYGAGMVVRKAPLLLLYRLGFRSILSDRKGKDLISGGDNELCIWFRWIGYDLFYSEALTFRHFIPGDRLTMNYLTKRSASKGKTEAFLLLYRDLSPESGGVKWLDSKLAWNLEILKRVFYFILYKLNPSQTTVSKLTTETLAASILFRRSNYEEVRTARNTIYDLIGRVKKSGSDVFRARFNEN